MSKIDEELRRGHDARMKLVANEWLRVAFRERTSPVMSKDAAIFRSWRGLAAREKTQGYIQNPCMTL